MHGSPRIAAAATCGSSPAVEGRSIAGAECTAVLAYLLQDVAVAAAAAASGGCVQSGAISADCTD